MIRHIRILRCITNSTNYDRNSIYFVSESDLNPKKSFTEECSLASTAVSWHGQWADYAQIITPIIAESDTSLIVSRVQEPIPGVSLIIEQ